MRPLAPICKFAAFPTLTFCQQVRRDTAPIALGGLAKVQNSSPPGIADREANHDWSLANGVDPWGKDWLMVANTSI